MTWYPLETIPRQFVDANGDPYSGAVLKAYEAGTSTPLLMATDSTGATTSTSFPLNASGYVTSGGVVIIPYVEENCDLALYPTQAAADLDSGAIWSVENIQIVSATTDETIFNTIDALTEETSIDLYNDTLPFFDDSAAVARKGKFQSFIGQLFQDKILYGLTLSNNSGDATNDIDIAAGAAVSDDGTTLMQLSSSITKQLDAAWAVGTNQGGRDTGSIADTTYHVWLINRPDTGVTDVLFSTSASSPTMPANYTKKKRIGSIIRVSGTILAFVQSGKDFLLNVSRQDIDATNPGTSAILRTLTVPQGVQVKAIISASVYPGTTTGLMMYISSPSIADTTPQGGSTAAPTGPGTVCADQQVGVTVLRCLTNTSSQVRSRLAASGASDRIGIHTYGWEDFSL